MKIGLLSDLHANKHALVHALEVLSELRAQALVCAGDVVGYGPYPNECVELLIEHNVSVVAGNHDLMAIGALSDEHESDFVKASNAWTKDQLGRDTRSYLEALPQTLTLGPLVVTHGSLQSPEQYVNDAVAARGQLELLGRLYPGASVLVLGHTHRPMLCNAVQLERPRNEANYAITSSPVVVNPGSVGQSRQLEVRPLARFGLVDLDAGSLSFIARAYDLQAAREEVKRLRFPRASLHLVPGRYASVARDSRYRALRSLGLVR